MESIGIEDGGRLYFKDLGPQIGWSTVSITANVMFLFLFIFILIFFI